MKMNMRCRPLDDPRRVARRPYPTRRRCSPIDLQAKWPRPRRAAAQIATLSLATLSQEYSSRATLSEHTMLTHTASPVHAQWFPLILDALMADKFVDFVDAFCECSVPPK